MYQFNAEDLTDPAALGMQPHPEGGWYVEHYRNTQDVQTPVGPRGLATAISFLLQPGQESAWHRVRSDELWFWQGGGLELGGDGAQPGDATTYTLRLGGQLLVPANVWRPHVRRTMKRSSSAASLRRASTSPTSSSPSPLVARTVR